MTPRFITVGELQLHVLSAGEGPPVVLLHPSPLSARAVMPMAESLSERFTVHAIDTPGYGLSDRPGARPRELDDYVEIFLGAFDALGIARCAIYGAATGAQLAIAIARRAPERVAVAVLDSAGHFDEAETARIIDGYFPDLTPADDGRHLATTWTMVRDLFAFFPWCDRRPRSRLDRDLPPAAVMQDFLLDYLRAGECYDWAYRPAFHHERVERAREISVPALLVRWPSSVVLAATDAMIAAGLPDNFTVLRPGPTPAERYAAVVSALVERYGKAPPGQPAQPSAPPAGRFVSTWLGTGGRLHARTRLQGRGRPLVMLHGAGGSASAMERAYGALAADRPAVCLDLPGHGESGPWVWTGADEAVQSIANQLDAALHELGIDEFDAVAAPLGARVLQAIDILRPGRCRQVQAVGANPPRTLPMAEWLDRQVPDLRAEIDGTHLWRAWQHVRDAALWSPWWQRTRAAARGLPLPGAGELQARLVDLMKAAPACRAAVGCEYGAD